MPRRQARLGAPVHWPAPAAGGARLRGANHICADIPCQVRNAQDMETGQRCISSGAMTPFKEGCNFQEEHRLTTLSLGCCKDEHRKLFHCAGAACISNTQARRSEPETCCRGVPSGQASLGSGNLAPGTSAAHSKRDVSCSRQRARCWALARLAGGPAQRSSAQPPVATCCRCGSCQPACFRPSW